MEGWRKLQETLGNKCLLVADKTFDGLPISPRREDRNDEITSLITDIEAERVAEEAGTKDGLEFVSCAAFTLDKTLSATFSKAVSVASEYLVVHTIHVCVVLYVHICQQKHAYLRFVLKTLPLACLCMCIMYTCTCTCVAFTCVCACVCVSTLYVRICTMERGGVVVVPIGSIYCRHAGGGSGQGNTLTLAVNEFHLPLIWQIFIDAQHALLWTFQRPRMQ